MTETIYVELTNLLHKRLEKNIMNENTLMQLRKTFFEKEFNKSYETFYQFNNDLMFTEEQINDLPEIKQLCTKSSNYSQLSQRNKKATELNQKWRTFIQKQNSELYDDLKKSMFGFAGDVNYLIRHRVFPRGRVTHLRLHDKSYLSSNCPSDMIIHDSIQRELTRAEFLELELEYEKTKKG